MVFTVLKKVYWSSDWKGGEKSEKNGGKKSVSDE